MSFFGVSGMYYFGESLQQHRIVLAEDSNLFAAMVSKRLERASRYRRHRLPRL